VDDFFIQYTNPADLEHLLQATLRQHYNITVDMAASKFGGMILDDWTTMKKVMSPSPCQDTTLRKPSRDSPIQPLPGPNTHPTHPWIVAPE
jgi:hypothetical protein